jgi:hypothetical protein
MSVTTAALVLAWVAIVALAAALAACVRALRFHEARLAQIAATPRRLAPGDRVRLPSEVRAAAGDRALLLFVSRDCRSCLAAVRRLGALAAGTDLPVVALWKGAAPPEGVPLHGSVTHVERQAAGFEDLRVGLLPTAVLVRKDRVVAAGAVGSPAAVEELWEAARADGPAPPRDRGTAAPSDGDRPVTHESEREAHA